MLELDNVDDGTIIPATYLEGRDGVLTNPGEPALPLHVDNVGVPGLVLRGVGYRGGVYQDQANVHPLVGAPTTELRSVHLNFVTDIFFPTRLWSVNYFDALADPDKAVVRLNVTPAQYLAPDPAPQTSTRRKHTRLDLRLYYSGNIDQYNDNLPALAAAPTVVRVGATHDAANTEADFQVQVVGNPGAGIQEVWVTYTAKSGPYTGRWQSLDLTQSANDSTVWVASLPLNGTPVKDLQFIAQAVNGLGLVTMATNLGHYYTVGGDEFREPTRLVLEEAPQAASNASVGPVGSTARFQALLTDADGSPLVGQRVAFGLGLEEPRGPDERRWARHGGYPVARRAGRLRSQRVFCRHGRTRAHHRSEHDPVPDHPAADATYVGPGRRNGNG